jgi:hypothetical protein
MTEAEWLASTDVLAMYVFLRDTTILLRRRGRQGHDRVPQFIFSERKSQLFAVAGCRRILHLVPLEATRAVVELAERRADGLADADELRNAVAISDRACHERAQAIALYGSQQWSHEREAVEAVRRLGRAKATGHYGGVMQAAALAAVWEAALNGNLGDAGRKFLDAERTRNTDLLRDIVGNPFQPSTVDPSWLAWNDRCIERMAQGIYEEQAYDRLPILHDALLDAGCDNERMLEHCRTAEGHVRGCWVIDLLLHKE